MRNLINKFPREIAFPQRQICLDEKRFYQLANANNKLKSIYYSLYDCDEKHNFDKCLIDKIAFDFDAENPAETIPEVLKFSDSLIKKDLRHLLVFSGKKGFHVYILCKNGQNLNYKKDALQNAQESFVNEFGLKYADKHLFGDIKRILRLPNSWHMKGGCYCIPIIRDDLISGIEYIKNKAMNQQFDFIYYGKELLNLVLFDNPRPKVYTEMPEYDGKIEVDDKIIEGFLPCVKCWLLNEKNNDGEEMGNWVARYQFALYCRDVGLTQEICDKIAKRYFSKVVNKGSLGGEGSNYHHWKLVKALQYAYNKGDFMMNCTTLWEKKLCPGKCRFFKEEGNPLYK